MRKILLARLFCGAVWMIAGEAVLWAESNIVEGKAIDLAGRPLPGVRVTAKYQMFGASQHSITRSNTTNADGVYRLDVSQPPGTWSVSAQIDLPYKGKAIHMNLRPDTTAVFAGNRGAVRNFALVFESETPESPYGYGGIVIVDNAILDYTPQEEMEVLLEPAGTMIDGSAGRPVRSRLRSTGEGWVVTGVPYGPYKVTVFHRGAPILIRKRQVGDVPWGKSVTTDFEDRGASLYKMNLEVKGR